MTTKKVQYIVDQVENLTFRELEKLIMEIEIIHDLREQEEIEEESKLTEYDLYPYGEIARENCEAFLP